MLHAISWKDFLSFITLGLVLYYGWWWVRWYPAWRIGRAGKAGPEVESWRVPAVMDKEVEVEEKKAPLPQVVGELATGASVAQEVTGGQSLLPAVVEKPELLPLVAGDLTNEVIALVELAGQTGMAEGELIFSFQKLLSTERYSRLRGTPFEGRITALIVRELENHGPMPFDVEVVGRWWLG